MCHSLSYRAGRRARITLCSLIGGAALLFWAAPALAGPQHWGFGFSYLASLEETGSGRRLVVYEPPLHAKDATWPSRWLDRTTILTDVPSGGLAVGDFWPAGFGREYLTTVGISGSNLTVKVYEPPECFSVRAWTLRSTSASVALTGTFRGATAGNLRRTSQDQLLVATQNGAAVRMAILTPPSAVTGTTWTKSAEADLPGLSGTYLGFACGDFWNENVDYLAIATLVGGATRLTFYSYTTGSNSFSLVAADAAADLPVLQTNGLAAGDFEKDGFDVLVLALASGGFQLRVAPAKSGQVYNPGPEYTGKALSGQLLPSNGGPASVKVMTGTFGATANSRMALAAGRLFGYVNTGLNSRMSIAPGLDAQIAFARRSPRKDQCGTYGWPSNGQTTSYEINLNNNGNTAIPGGAVRLKVWYNRANRNADTDPATCDAPDFDQVISETLPAYNPSAPTYINRTVSFPWPYSLIPAASGASWQKVNFEAVGERWVIAVIEYANDVNLRNNRYEMALASLTFHPIFRSQSSLADRAPTVSGDPPSKEYLSRKLADAVQCMWERSQTRDGQDVLHRLWFDSYEIGWPDDSSNPGQAWQVVQNKYEGWRELDGWWGVYQNWERFDWGDGGAELHETGHLFHPLGDLYQYYVSPVFTGGAIMADGSPVQLRTWMWSPDSFGSGHARISWPACELMKRAVVGTRNNSINAWWELTPLRSYVRVLDRDGNPVSGAEVKLWPERTAAPAATGTTGADGRWETTSIYGASSTDAFGRKHFAPPANVLWTQIYTVKIGSDYQDCAILGTEEIGAHSHHYRMGHSWTDETAWTWDLRTNYRPGAAPPDFTLTAAVQGSNASLGLTGPAGGAVYRVYRKWEPAYIRTPVGDYTAAGTNLTITQNMAAADSYGSGRFRAIYEVTRVVGGAESLPRTVQLTGVSGARGITARGDGKLLVAANAGIANPFCQVFDGTTPYQELFYHFRFGHTANKVTPSRLTSGKYYATLSSSDMDPDYRFDVIAAPTGTQYGYDVRNDIGGQNALAYTTTAPYTIRCSSAQAAAAFQAGDRVVGPAGEARVTQVTGDTLVLDALVFNPGSSNSSFSGRRIAGVPGSNSALRELQSARGLDTLLYNGAEYLIIADTGNRRVAVWNAATAYVTHWQSPDSSARPAAIATHPAAPGKFFMLDRRSSGTSKLYLFTFDGAALTVDAGYPVNVAVGDATDITEMGLAATRHPAGGDVALLVTDARASKVYQLGQVGGIWQTTNTFTQTIGVMAGSASLIRPGDVACASPAQNVLRTYVIDASSRVVMIDEVIAPIAQDASVHTRANTALQIALEGSSPHGNSLTYVITALPGHGSLSEPGSGPITAVPYNLANGGQLVNYQPETGFVGDDTLQFKVNDGQDSIPATVSISVGGPEPVYAFPMDTNPGWTVEGSWAFGQPAGGGGQYGGHDPTAGRTGSSVYGYNLNGDYEVNLPERHLTSAALNCSQLSNVSLRFWRWLGVEQPRYDHAYVRVSSDGVNWTTIWQNTTEVADTSWVYQEFDISAVADGKPAVYLRWTMGATDTSRRYCGWNIDDVEVWGVVQIGDCNGNGVPDDQDLAAGTSLDCNHNAWPDECDISSGTSQDVNHNGVPDECEVIPQIPGDFDRDGDVDQDDFAHLQLCFTDSLGLLAECQDANLDHQLPPFVDGSDLAVFRKCMSGSGNAGHPDCAK